MSAVSFAVVPTVSFRSSRWISPSTEPSISRSSVPVMSPFTCRLGPSRPVSWSAAASGGIVPSVLFLFHIGTSWGLKTPREHSGGVHQTRFPAPAYRNSLRDSALPRSLLQRGGGIKARRAFCSPGRLLFPLIDGQLVC